MTDLTGGCACGAVRFTATGEPRFAFICQCRACQKTTGSDHAPQVCHDADRFSVEGNTAHGERNTEDGNTVRNHFCPACGSPVYGTTSRAPAIVMILAGVLDDPAAVTPDRLFFHDERIPWDHARVETTPN